jgi:hypothetical protein
MCKKRSRACLMAEDNGEPKLSDELRLGNPFPPDCPPPPAGLIISGGTRRTPCWQGWKKPGFFKETQPSGFFNKKPAQWVFLVFFVCFLVFWGIFFLFFLFFFWVFWVFFLGFLGFFGVDFFVFFLFFFVFLYICPQERVFRVFSVSRILLGAYRL